MAFNQLEKLAGNVRAASIALSYQPGNKLDDQQINILRNYAGFGGIKAILYPNAPIAEWEKLNASLGDLSLYKPIMAFHKLLQINLSENEYEQTIAAIRESVLTAFYTPAFIPQTVYQVLNESGISPQRIYDPSAGAGVFVNEALSTLPNVELVTAVEKDVLTSRIMHALFAAEDKPVQVHHTLLKNRPLQTMVSTI